MLEISSLMFLLDYLSRALYKCVLMNDDSAALLFHYDYLLIIASRSMCVHFYLILRLAHCIAIFQ